MAKHTLLHYAVEGMIDGKILFYNKNKKRFLLHSDPLGNNTNPLCSPWFTKAHISNIRKIVRIALDRYPGSVFIITKMYKDTETIYCYE
jgi:hypothetical protein